jgi:hypothetical protein
VKRHIEKARSTLGELGGLAAKTESAERKILESAEARLDVVQKAIKRAQAGAEAAPEKEQDRYLALIEERGQLNIIITKAKRALGT